MWVQDICVANVCVAGRHVCCVSLYESTHGKLLVPCIQYHMTGHHECFVFSSKLGKEGKGTRKPTPISPYHHQLLMLLRCPVCPSGAAADGERMGGGMRGQGSGLRGSS